MDFFDLHVEDLKALTNKLKQFHKKYVSCFHTKTRDVSKQSLQYLKGIFIEKGRGNMVNYAKNMPDTPATLREVRVSSCRTQMHFLPLQALREWLPEGY